MVRNKSCPRHGAKFVGIAMMYEKFRSELSDEQSNFIQKEK